MQLAELPLAVGAGGAQAGHHLAQEHAVGLAGLAHPGAQLRAGPGHRQLVVQPLDLAQVQLGRLPARQQADLGGDRRRDVGVAVAVAAHPGAEAHRGRVERQPLAGGVEQRPIQLAQVGGQGVPQDLIEQHQPGPGLVDRGGAPAPQLIGLPDGLDLAPQVLRRRRPLLGQQVGPVARRQRLGDAPVLLQQGPARRLGGVGGQHQLHVQRAHRLVQPLGRHPALQEPGEGLGDGPAGPRRAQALAPQPHPVLLLGDVGERQEVGEGPGQRHRLGHGQRPQQRPQRLRRLRPAGAGLLGQGPHPLHQRVQRGALLGAQGLAQQIAQQAHVLAQPLVDV